MASTLANDRRSYTCKLCGGQEIAILSDRSWRCDSCEWVSALAIADLVFNLDYEDVMIDAKERQAELNLQMQLDQQVLACAQYLNQHFNAAKLHITVALAQQDDPEVIMHTQTYVGFSAMEAVALTSLNHTRALNDLLMPPPRKDLALAEDNGTIGNSQENIDG